MQKTRFDELLLQIQQHNLPEEVMENLDIISEKLIKPSSLLQERLISFTFPPEIEDIVIIEFLYTNPLLIRNEKNVSRDNIITLEDLKSVFNHHLNSSDLVVDDLNWYDDLENEDLDPEELLGINISCSVGFQIIK